MESFPLRGDTAIAEFLFDGWILKALCNDANKTGLVTNVALNGALRQNLSLVKDALTALISSKEDFEIVMQELPLQIA